MLLLSKIYPRCLVFQRLLLYPPEENLLLLVRRLLSPNPPFIPNLFFPYRLLELEDGILIPNFAKADINLCFFDCLGDGG